MGMGGRAASRAFLTTMVIFGLVWLLFASLVTARKHAKLRRKVILVSTSSGDSKSKHWKFVEEGEKHGRALEDDLHLNYVSKRRVPTGPDPIHNRKTTSGTNLSSGQPIAPTQGRPRN